MSELVIHIGDSATYEDGDVLCAFNRRRTRCVHAEHICHLDWAGFTNDGRRPLDCLAKDFREATCQYRFRRLNNTEVARIEIVTGKQDRFDSTPRDIDGHIQHIDVAEFVRRRLKHAKHAIFGIPGREIWYGGTSNTSMPALDKVWKAIHLKTSLRETQKDFQFMPFGLVFVDLRVGYRPIEDVRPGIRQYELYDALTIPVVDFTEEESVALVRSIIDDSDPTVPQIIKKRAVKANWHTATVLSRLGLTEMDIKDKPKKKDKRQGVLPLKYSSFLFDKSTNAPVR